LSKTFLTELKVNVVVKVFGTFPVSFFQTWASIHKSSQENPTVVIKQEGALAT